MILKKPRIFLLFILITANFLTGCKSEEKMSETANLKKIGAGFYVFAEKNGTNIKVSLENSPQLIVSQVKFNGKVLENREEKDGRIEFKDFVAAISDLGIFWAVLNEPPPGSLRLKRARNKDEKN